MKMSSAPAFVCSMCRKPIAVGAKLIRCAVSTCNTGRVRLMFCSSGCWDSHLPNARHRTAYFVEEIARRE
jgi:LSD1 subclass zinc finger protein